MIDLISALGLVLFLEGAAMALFPDYMRRMMAEMIETPSPVLRGAGLASAVVGVIVVWFVRG